MKALELSVMLAYTNGHTRATETDFIVLSVIITRN